ncbi:AAA family ATPase [Shewanella sp. SR43-4]|jgi:general secretion pathway protein A|uniref:ExeA family protein n=1 Tax=Shewanella TaxID=22 RepID=UPI000C481215|nr:MULTISPECIES: AAA family ATPase [Shewanella]NCQ44691.1 AAA family ATPase [Shewanella frigidimarina]MBB1318644.1 AAA family ATPase [Shewanella sp. SR43-4]MBB1321265.1 AAA family ATPase [Shewanella sp. SR43-8]NCO72991.1 AAA family ATPase [Shewanella vesiculosa]NCP36034.1 AAA family ATPase [Shewanella vesiculosa]|tara:strand:- start:224 stop:1897 length:1674 start_codon:yes stop_codon:yes gene_type:complete
MYKAFYGLNDNPFSIAPNPHYMFLSDRHREALAHLTYGLGETGGFVLLTGEVGTGKTTVSRCLLQQIPENTDTAFILNPSLTELELLATLCDELEIKYGENPTLKQLTDLISTYLLTNHKNARNTVLIIDEAQHLRSEVLEQLRLLTNLETNTKKLLQVILIGQPELQQLLKRQDLRQLAQRITARYHLLPLNKDEIGLYVLHRLQVAGRHEPLFTRKAIAALHKHSGGIPRLTNLLCERALMAGYGQAKVPIDHKMVNQAAVEVLGDIDAPSDKRWPFVAATALVLAFGLSFYLFNRSANDDSLNSNTALASNQTQQSVNPPALATIPSATNQSITASTSQLQTSPPVVNAQQQILRQAMLQSSSIDNAFAGLFGLWNKQPIIGLSACQAAQQQDLACYQQQGNWYSIMRLNYPAVVYLQDAQANVFYGVIVERQVEQILLQLGEQQFWVNKDWFDRHFSGTFEILWQPDGVLPREIGQSSSLAQVQWLENSLALVNKRRARLLTQFDGELEQQLMQFQRQHGLKPDGIAGNQTLVQLNLYLSQQGPRLSASSERS